MVCTPRNFYLAYKSRLETLDSDGSSVKPWFAHPKKFVQVSNHGLHTPKNLSKCQTMVCIPQKFVQVSNHGLHTPKICPSVKPWFAYSPPRPWYARRVLTCSRRSTPTPTPMWQV